jgi:hypothetical protein
MPCGGGAAERKLHDWSVMHRSDARRVFVRAPRVRQRPAWRHVAALVVTLAASPAHADGDVQKTLAEPTRETGLLPLIGGDTDIGVGIGAIGSVAMFDRTHHPYRWQLQFSAFAATKSGPMSPSYEDAYALLVFPQLLDGRLRLELRPSFTQDTTLPYYGIGNRAPAPAQTVAARDFYQRVHPAMQALTRWTVWPSWSVLVGAQYIYNRLEIDPASTLAMDLARMDPAAARPHSVLKLETGLVYDTRDSEISTGRGQFHQVTLRVSPSAGDGMPYQYEQVDAMARFYTTLIPDRVVLAARGVFDVEIGDVPFYELSRYEDTSAIGGGMAIRGVPSYRYYGKVKLFGNLELRTAITRFGWLGRSFKLGVASFFDAGRLWSGMTNPRPELDGSGLGLHYGVGGGLRLQQGKAFTVRADVAWSPDARPVGAYVLADEIF